MHLFDYLRWMVQEGARFELSNPLLAQVASRALFSDRPFGDEPFNQMRKATLEFYDQLIRTGIDQGVIDSTIDTGLAIFLLSTLFNHFGEYLMEREQVDIQQISEGAKEYRNVELQELTEQLISILQRGLAPQN